MKFKLAILSLVLFSCTAGAAIEISVDREMNVSLPPVEVVGVNLKPMVDEMLLKIKHDVRYPPRLVHKGIQGTSLIKFNLSKTKGVTDIEVTESAGNESLDKAAIKAITNIDLSIIPEAAGNEEFILEVPVEFIIRRS